MVTVMRVFLVVSSEQAISSIQQRSAFPSIVLIGQFPGTGKAAVKVHVNLVPLQLFYWFIFSLLWIN